MDITYTEVQIKIMLVMEPELYIWCHEDKGKAWCSPKEEWSWKVHVHTDICHINAFNDSLYPCITVYIAILNIDLKRLISKLRNKQETLTLL